jgi:hypothetical protein
VTCEFFLTCWLSGGLLESPCDGLLRGCCQRGASKTGQSASLAVGTLEAPRESPKSVAADADYRKWYRTLVHAEASVYILLLNRCMMFVVFIGDISN